MSRTVTVFAFLFLLPAANAKLKVGDPAPPLKVAKWVKGKPVDISEGKDKQIYVVEFWATWCPPCRTSIPHLTKMAHHFQKAVTFIGVSIDKDQSKVGPFVEEWGKKMDYNVAWGEEAKKAYFDAAGAEGIPHAFLIAKDGRIAWQGHPMDGLDLKIAEMVGDKTYAEDVKRLKDLQKKLNTDMGEEEWSKALGGVEALIKLEPSEPQWLIEKHRILVLKKDLKDAEKWGQEILGKIDEADPLNEMAWKILTEEEYAEAKDLKLALGAAKKANELTGGKNWMILDTYARALFETKSVKEAVEVEKKAIEIAKKKDAPDEAMEVLKDSLEKYEHPEKKSEEKDTGEEE